MGLNSGLDMARSYYVATAPEPSQRPRLAGHVDVDLAVVGGGCTGLSAALHAAQAGLSVAVLEAGRLGWGASGRNGGQMIPGLRKGAVELIRAFGLERARALFDLSLEARDLVLKIILDHAIACDLQLTGHLSAAVRPGSLRALEGEAAALSSVMGYGDAELIDAEAMRAHVASPYRGGLLDRRGGHLHPLKYALGLAAAAEGAGARLYEETEARSLEARGGGTRIRTTEGVVDARRVILAGDALLQGLAPGMTAHIMPVANYIVVTEPLQDARSLIPTNVAVSDTRFVVNYYRLTGDGRLMFGGGERYTRTPPRDIAAFVRPHLERTFPQVRGCAIASGWGGLVSITTTRMPHLGRTGAVLYAHGYSGMGVLLSTLAGKLLVEEVLGEGARFDVFAGAAPGVFPGGVALRGLIHLLGMLWYASRDRLP